MPTAWDHFFTQREPCWVLFHLRSGQLLAGYFGPRSFAGSSAHHRDIYIEQVWATDDDGQFVWQLPDTAGALVSLDECTVVQFFRTKEDLRNRTSHGHQG